MPAGMKKERAKQKSIENIVKDVIKDLSGKGRGIRKVDDLIFNFNQRGGCHR